jgi:hypothetical protein
VVDAPPLDAISITDLARKRGVSKQAISKRVKALTGEGRLSLWPGPNRSVMVSESAYDFAIGLTGDPAKEAAAASAAELRGAGPQPDRDQSYHSENQPPATIPEGETPAYRDAKARDAYYAAELKRLNFERQNGQLYSVEEIEAAMSRISDAVRDVAKGIVSRADEGAEAIESGMPAFRRWLVLVGDDICRSLASQWRILADEIEKPEAGHGTEEVED